MACPKFGSLKLEYVAAVGMLPKTKKLRKRENRPEKKDSTK